MNETLIVGEALCEFSEGLMSDIINTTI